jgi:hypothetical protein
MNRGPVAWAPIRHSTIWRHDAGTDGAVAFADREARPLLERDRLVELDCELGIVARHHHLDAVAEADGAGDVGLMPS